MAQTLFIARLLSKGDVIQFADDDRITGDVVDKYPSGAVKIAWRGGADIVYPPYNTFKVLQK